ncbi:MAG: 8-amino-7-oxononanoate synthase [Myxococcales bacterium]|nr:8-amino-7-oxononanoate synthase [Myxococcales bacterium]
MPDLSDDLRERLTRRHAAGLLRQLRELEDVGPVVVHAGQRLLNFSSNDYLGLAGSPALREALAQAGAVGAPASRLITGHLRAHAEIERALAAYVEKPAALLFTAGYAANVGAIPALVGPGDLILSDALNHASLIDGCRLSRAEVRTYVHGDVESLRAGLDDRERFERVLIVTDAVFSMDGDPAPLVALSALARAHDAWLYVDEAHSLGVRGGQGAGLCQELGVQPDVLVGTLGKAFGVAGAFVAGPVPLRDWLLNTARSFVFSTAYPAALLPALTRSLELVVGADAARAQLRANADHLRAGLRALGLPVLGDHAIVPVLVGENERALSLGAALRERGVLGLPIRPPTVPPGTARIRLTPMATHTVEQVDQVVRAVAESL